MILGSKNRADEVLVIFGQEFPINCEWIKSFDVIIADKLFREQVEAFGAQFVDLETLVDAGSVHEAAALLEELPKLSLADGSSIAKSFTYGGYELWWIHYNSLFYYYCLPYTRYQRLLEYIRSFRKISFYHLPQQDKNMFSHYLQAYQREMFVFRNLRLRVPSFLPFGVVLQILITLLSLPILMIKRQNLLVFTGDKFDQGKDYDFRMKFIYQELRQRNLPFVEFIRSLEPWRVLLKHAAFRKRPVVYSEAVAFVGRFLSVLSGGRRHLRQRFGPHVLASEANPERRFKLLIATQHLLTIYDDIWAVRVMRQVLRIIGVRVAIIEIASGRSFHTVLGCKLNSVPIVGILHGVSSRYATPHDYMTGFSGNKMLSVDAYGVWSQWWKDHYIKNSQAYKPEQLHVSGPMRPLLSQQKSVLVTKDLHRSPRALFIAEQTAAPNEVMPYLRELLKNPGISLTIKFRSSGDGFERWLSQNEPEILQEPNLRIIKGNMQDAINDADVVIGCHSTGVLEALLQLRVPIFIRTRKWGDYYGMAESDELRGFFAENPAELMRCIEDYRNIPGELLAKLREQYFGDPYQNGSVWVVDRAEQLLKKFCHASLEE